MAWLPFRSAVTTMLRQRNPKGRDGAGREGRTLAARCRRCIVPADLLQEHAWTQRVPPNSRIRPAAVPMNMTYNGRGGVSPNLEVPNTKVEEGGDCLSLRETVEKGHDGEGDRRRSLAVFVPPSCNTITRWL